MAAPVSDRTAVRRHDRGVYDRDAIATILDEALYCHVGIVDRGVPIVLPTIHARDRDTLYLHGAPGTRLLKVLRAGGPACVTVTLLDGLVLARSAFHHSMNYRSVVVLGAAREVTDAAEKLRALERIVEQVIPGRSRDVRGPTTRELARTSVLALPLDEASAKVRTGPPVDDEQDYDLDVWAGEIPLCTVMLPARDDPRLGPRVARPAYAERLSRIGVVALNELRL